MEEEDTASLQSVPADFNVPIITASECTYERVERDFFIPNLPFIVTGITNDWKAQRDWIINEKKEAEDAVNGTREARQSVTTPNWEYLSSEYGEFTVSVLQCPLPSLRPGKSTSPSSKLPSSGNVNNDNEEEDGDEDEMASYGSGEIVEMKFKDVIELWKSGKGQGMYIKDWHLKRQVRERGRLSRRGDGAARDPPKAVGIAQKAEAGDDDDNGNDKDTMQEEEEETSFYTTPEIFQNDWMDNYYTNNTNDDFSFVYFGTVGTFTPLHRDVCEYSFDILPIQKAFPLALLCACFFFFGRLQAFLYLPLPILL